MRIEPIHSRQDNYIWAIQNTQRQAIIFCPGESAPVLDWLQQNKTELVAILVTHKHYDHTDGIEALVKATQCAVYGPADEPIPCNNHPVQAGDIIRPASGFPEFHVIGCPGHTLGHVAYYAKPWLFPGDTLFSSGCGRMFEGTAAQFTQTLNTLKSLPEETQIYCAHEYTLANLAFAATVEPHNEAIQEKIRLSQLLRAKKQPTLPSLLKNEQLTNPFLRLQNKQVIQAAEAKAKQALTTEQAVFATLRKWKDNF